MSKVILHPSSTRAEPDAMLEHAKGKFKSVLIIGEGNDGQMHYFAGGGPTNSEVLWWLETHKMNLLLEWKED